MKSHQKTKSFIIVFVSAAFILLFTYTGVSKLADFQNFELELGKSPLLTYFSHAVALIIPMAELLVSIGLVFSATRLISLYASFGLMTLFTAYLVTVLKFSDFVPCTCGGVIQEMDWSTHILFNSVFTLLAAVSVLLYNKNFVLQYNRNSRTPE